MTIRFQCPHCGKQTDVADHFAGKSGPCVDCGQTILIPGVAVDGGAATAGAGGGMKRNSMPLLLIFLGGGLLFAMVIIGVLVALLLPAVQATRSQSRQIQCLSQARQIGMAFESYHAVHGHYPPSYIADEDGRPLHSWRVLILPYLGPDENALYDQFDLNQPWDDPANRRLVDQMPSIYACPASEMASAMSETSYCVVEGPAFMFDADKTVAREDLLEGEKPVLMLVEVNHSAIEWTEPKDVDADRLACGINSGMQGCCGSEHRQGIVVLFSDGSSEIVSETTPPAEFVEMASRRKVPVATE